MKTIEYCTFQIPYSKMPVMNIRRTLLILVVGVLTPSMDQVSDLRLVIRLMSGPEGSTHLQSGIKNLE